MFNVLLLRPITQSVPTTDAASNLNVLGAVLEGAADKAISYLEAYLDGSLISLSAIPDSDLDDQAIAVIRRAAAYREIYPYRSSEPAVAERVSELLSKHKTNGSEPK